MDCCKRCGIPGHGAAACATEKNMAWCNRCKIQGHFWFYCKKITCNQCGQPGHLKHHCTKTAPIMMICYDSNSDDDGMNNSG